MHLFYYLIRLRGHNAFCPIETTIVNDVSAVTKDDENEPELIVAAGELAASVAAELLGPAITDDEAADGPNEHAVP